MSGGDDGGIEPFRALAAAYAAAVDRGDAEGLAALFTADAVLDSEGHLFEGRDAIRTIPPMVTTMFVKTMHFVHNQTVRVGPGGDEAEGETYGVASHIIAADDGGWSKLDWAIRYQDRFRREDGAWRFSARRLIVEWTQTTPVERYVRPPARA